MNTHISAKKEKMRLTSSSEAAGSSGFLDEEDEGALLASFCTG